MSYFFETISTVLSGILVYLITKQYRDLKSYRKKREADEMRKEAKKIQEQSDIKTCIQYLILTQFAYEKQRVAELGVFSSEDRIEYQGLLVAGEALGFDGRMHSYWDFCCQHPDENGKIYGD